MRERSSTWRWQPVLAGPSTTKAVRAKHINTTSTNHQLAINAASTPHQQSSNTASTRRPLSVHDCPLNVHEPSTSGPQQPRAIRTHGMLVITVIKPADCVRGPAAGSDSCTWVVTACQLLCHQHFIDKESTARLRGINTPSTPHQQNINTADAQLADAAPAVLVSKRPAPGLSRASDQVLMAREHRSQKSVGASRGDARRQQRPGSPPCHGWHPQAATPVSRSLQTTVPSTVHQQNINTRQHSSTPCLRHVYTVSTNHQHRINTASTLGHTASG
jgi:hypothetical protein